MKAALYIRVSTDDQSEFSPEAQKKSLLLYAKNHNIQVEHKHIYIDEGYSGRKAEKRPGFMKMIENAKKKPAPFNLILVHKFDRFARNREDSVIYKSLLKKECNIKVISITERLEDDKFSIILESMLEAMAEYYSLNLSEEVLKGMTEKAYRGGLQTRPPLGYYVENNQLIPCPEEAKIIQWIFNEALKKIKPSVIAGKLNRSGIKTKNNCYFEGRTIKYILKNETYIGITKWRSIKIADTHPAIITPELFFQVQKLIK